MNNLGNQNHWVFNDDCIVAMENLVKINVKFNAVICDMPFGVTNNSWDSKLNLNKIWDLLSKLRVSETTPIILFADKKEWYRYEWIWDKVIATGFLDVAYKPLMNTEKIFVFIEKPFTQVKSLEDWKKYDRIANFYPQYTIGKPVHSSGTTIKNSNSTYGKYKTLNEIKITQTHKTEFYRAGLKRIGKEQAYKHPKQLITFSKQKSGRNTNYHPTAKPPNLIEYLVKTYTKENDLILDFCAGGGSLLEACQNTNRKSVSIELEPKYIEMILSKLNLKDQNEKISHN